MAGWCAGNDKGLNVSKTTEKVFDFRKKKTPLSLLPVAGEVAKQVKTFKFLGTTISCDLKWDENVSTTIKKTHERNFL